MAIAYSLSIKNSFSKENVKYCVMEIYYILKHNFLETLSKLLKYKPQVPNCPSIL